MKVVKEYITLNENLDQARAILKRENIPETNPAFQELKNILEKDNKLGFIGIFTKWMFKDKNSSFEEIKNLYNLIKSITIKLPSAHQFNSAEEMYDNIRSLEINAKVASLIKRIPSRAREVLNTPKLGNLIKAYPDNVDDIRSFFVHYSGGFVDSEYKKPEEFIPSLEAYLENLRGRWNLKTALDNIFELGDQVHIRHKSPELLAFVVKSFESSHKLGSQEWCISTTPTYFDSYADIFSSQYFIYDFTRKPRDVRSMIAATINQDGKIKEIAFRNNHEYYYPNHSQPSGYQRGKLHDPAIHAEDYIRDLFKNIN